MYIYICIFKTKPNPSEPYTGRRPGSFPGPPGARHFRLLPHRAGREARSQRAQYPLIKEYSLNQNMKPLMI